MSDLVITYGANGKIRSWRYEVDDDYSPAENELVADDDVDHRALQRKRVDTSTTPPQLVDDPNYRPPADPNQLRGELEGLSNKFTEFEQSNPVRRGKVTEQQKQAFRNARSGNDIQTQLDILFEVITGEEP